MFKFKCPSCGSKDVRKCSIIYDSELNSVSEVKNKNLEKISPPSKKKEFWNEGFVCGAICVFLLVDVTFSFFYIGITIFFGLVSLTFFILSGKAQEYNEKKFAVDYDSWTKSYFCNKCGNIFHMK
ncbi:MAG: hypothetical protein IK062_07835 [Selenomonadaceae bacterium]|nr:hypothetical protein [Selenomonadaceae bacterium]